MTTRRMKKMMIDDDRMRTRSCVRPFSSFSCVLSPFVCAYVLSLVRACKNKKTHTHSPLLIKTHATNNNMLFWILTHTTTRRRERERERERKEGELRKTKTKKQKRERERESSVALLPREKNWYTHIYNGPYHHHHHENTVITLRE